MRASLLALCLMLVPVTSQGAETGLYLTPWMGLSPGKASEFQAGFARACAPRRDRRMSLGGDLLARVSPHVGLWTSAGVRDEPGACGLGSDASRWVVVGASLFPRDEGRVSVELGIGTGAVWDPAQDGGSLTEWRAGVGVRVLGPVSVRASGAFQRSTLHSWGGLFGQLGFRIGPLW